MNDLLERIVEKVDNKEMEIYMVATPRTNKRSYARALVHRVLPLVESLRKLTRNELIAFEEVMRHLDEQDKKSSFQSQYHRPI